MPADTRTEPWRVEAGERESMKFPVVDSGDDIFPIDGWDISAEIKTRPGGAVLYTFPPEHITFDSDDNTIELVIPAPVSKLWTWTSGHYAVYISNPDTSPSDPATFRILEGPLIVSL